MSSRPKLVYEYFKQLFAQVSHWSDALFCVCSAQVVLPRRLRLLTSRERH